MLNGNGEQELPEYYSLSNLRLLIIDDDESLSNSIKLFFEDHECEVDLASNGEIGVHKFLNSKHDIVLVDLNMPGADGYYVISSIQRSSPDTPIIVVSGTGVIREAIRSMNLGAWDFVTKPIMHFEELEMSVLRALEKSFLIKENREYKTNLESLVIERTTELEKNKKELELTIEELKKSKEYVERSDKIKTEFLAQISHEIRTPLNTIINYTNYFHDLIETIPEINITDEYGKIKKASDRLIRTVELLVEMSELQTGVYNYKAETVDLKKMVLETSYNYEHKIKDKNIQFNVSLTADETVAAIDKYSFEQILENIFNNAYKYTENGRIEVTLFNQNGYIVLLLSDTGIGMSDNYLKQLFEPFTQEDTGYSRSYEGNGLGLAVTKKYCDLNSINLIIESKKGLGTKVFLYIENKLNN